MGEILGQKVVEMRKLRHITQQDLCKGICSQGTISLIEKGKMLPGIDILIALSLRLNVPITYFVEAVYLENTAIEMELLEKVEVLLRERTFEEIYQIAKNELNSESKNNWYRYYFRWLYDLCSYHTNKITIDEAIIRIATLEREAPKQELNKNYLSTRIQNSLAVLYAEKKDYTKSIFYYKKIDLDLIQTQVSFDFHSFKLKIIVNKMKTFYDMEDYDEALRQAKLGIEESIRVDRMVYMGNFYYYLGQCYEKINYKDDEIAKQYHRARFFFEILGREKLLEVLDELKGKWFI